MLMRIVIRTGSLLRLLFLLLALERIILLHDLIK